MIKSKDTSKPLDDEVGELTGNEKEVEMKETKRPPSPELKNFEEGEGSDSYIFKDKLNNDFGNEGKVDTGQGKSADISSAAGRRTSYPEHMSSSFGSPFLLNVVDTTLDLTTSVASTTVDLTTTVASTTIDLGTAAATNLTKTDTKMGEFGLSILKLAKGANAAAIQQYYHNKENCWFNIAFAVYWSTCETFALSETFRFVFPTRFKSNAFLVFFGSLTLQLGYHSIW